MLDKSSLSSRGDELASAGGLLDKFKSILEDLYDPDTNPNGFVNIGTAENVRVASLIATSQCCIYCFSKADARSVYHAGRKCKIRQRACTHISFILPPISFSLPNYQQINLDPKDFSYGEGPWGSLRLRKAMAKHMNRHFKPHAPIQADRLLFANGVTSLCEMLGFTICDAGDVVLLSRPIYQAFKSDFGAKAR